MGAHFALNLANFSNKQHLASNPSYVLSDSYSFVMMPGFDLAAGYQFTPNWRAELNYGYNGSFNDTDSLVDFTMSAQYLMLNALYTMAQWTSVSAYIGAGAGGAMINSRISGPLFVIDNNDSATTMTFAVQGIIGLEYALTDSFSVGAQYRLMYNGGATHNRGVIGGDTYVAKISGILTNSLMLGARYKF
ncbi:MAG: outer membrane beta-barrel protein [Proteobacteria bacterium]|nr:outer membrane beta-barrel protein [Pseudomonadota bacterium]